GPEVDDHVEDGAVRAAAELRLGVRRPLEVQAAHRPGGGVPRDARVDDVGREAVRRELLARERAREEAPLVASRLRLDQERAGELGLLEPHSGFTIGRTCTSVTSAVRGSESADRTAAATSAGWSSRSGRYARPSRSCSRSWSGPAVRPG